MFPLYARTFQRKLTINIYTKLSQYAWNFECIKKRTFGIFFCKNKCTVVVQPHSASLPFEYFTVVFYTGLSWFPGRAWNLIQPKCAAYSHEIHTRIVQVILINKLLSPQTPCKWYQFISLKCIILWKICTKIGVKLPTPQMYKYTLKPVVFSVIYIKLQSLTKSGKSGKITSNLFVAQWALKECREMADQTKSYSRYFHDDMYIFGASSR